MRWDRTGRDQRRHYDPRIVERVSPFVIIVVALVPAVVLMSSAGFATDPVLERIRKERVQERANGYLAEGKGALKRNHNIRAIRVLSDAIRLGAVPEGFKFRGQAHANLGETESALQDFNSYLSINPSDHLAHKSRGDVYFARREFGKAIQDYSSALALDKTQIDVYRARGAAYIACEEYERARSDLETVLRRNPGDVEALTNLALACRLSGMSAAARHFLNRAIEVETEESWNREIREQLANLVSQMNPGDREGSVSAFLSWGTEQTGSPGTRRKNVRDLANVRQPTSQIDSASLAVSRDIPMGALQRRRPSLISSKRPQVDISGRWDTTYRGHTVSLLIKQTDTRLTGVFTIRNPSGKENTYHFQGTFDGTHVVASHHDGNSFRGRLTDGRLVGVLSTRYGRSFSVDMSR